MTSSLSIEILQPQHDRVSFDCGVEALNRYLKTQASQDVKRFITKVYVATVFSSPKIIGFYTLSATRIELEDLPKDFITKLPYYPHVPAILLGRLAIDRNYQGKKQGRLLLMDALYKSYQNNVAAMAIVVEAKDEKAKNFYKFYDFIEFKDHPNKLFLPMKKVKNIFQSIDEM